MDIHHWTLLQTIEFLNTGKCSSNELTEFYLQRIERFNSKLHAYLTISRSALEEAKKIDNKRVQHPNWLGLLAGVPLSVKDLFDTTDLPTTYGGRHFENYYPTRSASVVNRLRQADAIILGKTNLHEYAYGTTNENPHFGTTFNPWNRSKISGGSSGGSAVSISAGLAVASLGTDTGGSIRIPAALTGVVGFKPTYGLISKAATFPLAATLDHVGPITKSVADAAYLLHLLAGYDAADPSTYQTHPENYFPLPSAGKPIRVGIPKQFFFDKCHTGVLQTIQAAVRVLETVIIQSKDIDVPNIEMVPEMQATIIGAEAYEIHETRLLSASEKFGKDVLQRLQDTATLTAMQYIRALHFRQQFQTELLPIFDEVDVILTPTLPFLATDVGQTKAFIGTQELSVRGHLTRYTNPWNFSGFPAISIPCGVSGGLPVGMQLIAAPFQDRKLLAMAQAFEQVLQWNPIAPDYR